MLNVVFIYKRVLGSGGEGEKKRRKFLFFIMGLLKCRDKVDISRFKSTM